MTNEKSWVILEKRLNTLLTETSQPYQIREILQAVRTSFDGTSGMEDVHTRLAGIIHTCCGTVRARLDTTSVWVASGDGDLSAHLRGVHTASVGRLHRLEALV